jgi:hypothetical protein
MEDKKLQLKKELEKYLDDKKGFLSYYPDMNVFTSNLYREQLKDVLKNIENSKSFALYLDTIIINMHTKAKKYKKSIYFENENIKDIENQGYTIPFYFDEKNNIYVLLGLLSNQA